MSIDQPPGPPAAATAAVAPSADRKTIVDREAQQVRASGILGRSPLLNWMFDFLVDHCCDSRGAKEVEMAAVLRASLPTLNQTQDAPLRVYAHRLRRKLDDFYRDGGTDTGVRLRLPRGEYRLVCEPRNRSDADLDEAGADAAPADDHAAPTGGEDRPRRRLHRSVAVAVLAALLVLGWWAVSRPPPAAEASVPWKGIGAGGRPVYLVVGDYFIFGEHPALSHEERLIRHFDINSPEDLDTYLMAHPDRIGQYVNLNLHYLPEGAANAIAAVVPQIVEATGQRPRIVVASNLTADMMREGDVVYVGYLSGLGMLRDEVFLRSRFTIGLDYDEILDQRTGKRYRSDWGVTAEGRTPHIDFGYFAALKGRSGHRLIILAGTRDAALTRVSELASSPAALRDLTRQANDRPDFEAVLKVNSIGNTDLSSTLVAFDTRTAAAVP